MTEEIVLASPAPGECSLVLPVSAALAQRLTQLDSGARQELASDLADELERLLG